MAFREEEDQGDKGERKNKDDEQQRGDTAGQTYLPVCGWGRDSQEEYVACWFAEFRASLLHIWLGD